MKPVAKPQAGFSYAETLLAIVVLALALVPAMESLQQAFSGSAVHSTAVQWHNQLATRLEEVRAESFVMLEEAAETAGNETTPSSYSDIAGGVDRLLVFISRYDGDNADSDGDPFTGTDDGLLWVRVAIENTPYAMTTLVAQ